MGASEEAGAELTFNVFVYFRCHLVVSSGSYDPQLRLKVYYGGCRLLHKYPQYKHTWKGHNKNKMQQQSPTSQDK